MVKWTFFCTTTSNVGNVYPLSIKNPCLHKFLPALEVQFLVCCFRQSVVISNVNHLIHVYMVILKQCFVTLSL